MKMNKLVSVFSAVAMLSSVLAASVSADATITWDADNGVYRVENAEDVSTRTPYIETTVSQMTAEEIVALGTAKTSSLSALKLKNASGKYGDTTMYTMYKVDGVFKNVGDLVMGYDSNDETLGIQLMCLDATIDIAGVDGIADIGYDTTANATTGIAWKGGRDNDTMTYGFFNQLGTDNAIPKGDTEEGGIISADYPFTVYFVMNAGSKATVSFKNGYANVQYYVNKNVIPVDIMGRTSTFELKEKATTVDVTGVTLDKTAVELDLNGTTTATLTATVAPDNATDKTVTWETSDATVATVENGVVTAKKVGTATITAKAGNQSATCAVTVTDSTPAPTPDPVGTLIAENTYYVGAKDLTGLNDNTKFVIKYGGQTKEIAQTLAQILGGEGIAENLTGKLHFAIKPVSVDASELVFGNFIIETK